MSDSPFIPGARVVVYQRWTDAVTEDFVLKVHKNGNITLRSDPKQQWRPYKRHYSDPPRWSAMATGEGYSKPILDLWDEATDTEIKEKLALHKRKQRLITLRKNIERQTGETITEDQLTAMEKVLGIGLTLPL